MNEIILIEDRPGRQAQLMKDEQLEILCDKEFLYMPREERCRKLIDDINSNDTAALSNYALIIVHRSSLNNIGIKALDDLCQSKKIDLILFSGGLSQLIFTRGQYQSLSLNSKEFYNDYLLDFLEKYSQEKSTTLLELVYQSNWKLELLMRQRLLATKEESEEDDYTRILLEEETKQLEKITGVSNNKLNSVIDKLIATL